MGAWLDRLQRRMPLLHNTRAHIWSYNIEDLLWRHHNSPTEWSWERGWKDGFQGLRDV